MALPCRKERRKGTVPQVSSIGSVRSRSGEVIVPRASSQSILISKGIGMVESLVFPYFPEE